MHPVYKRLKYIVNEAKINNVDLLTVKILIKEHLQSYILGAIYSSLYAKNLIFYGGTALRKIYSLDRMSENLDFETNKKIELDNLAKTIIIYFKKLKFEKVDYKIQSGKIINRITFKFPVLFELGLSPLKSEKLHVKIEINPQINKDIFETQLSPFMEDQMSMIIKHYSLPVLMAGKIAVCLDRVLKKGKTGILIKGRDYYDLIWYMEQQITPDKKRLKKSGYSTDKALSLLDKKVEKIKASDLLLDLQLFFTSRAYIKNWCNNFHQFYKRYRQFYT